MWYDAAKCLLLYSVLLLSVSVLANIFRSCDLFHLLQFSTTYLASAVGKLIDLLIVITGVSNLSFGNIWILKKKNEKNSSASIMHNDMNF